MPKQTFLFICLLLFSFCAQAQLDSELDKLFESLSGQDQPGGSIAIVKGDDVIYSKSFGLADIEKRVVIDKNTIFNTGSISKTVVAYGILILEEEGKLSIEDPLLKYFPDFINNDIVKDVKLKHLLSHSSGLPDIRNVSSHSSFFLDAGDFENFEPIKKAIRLNFEAGSQFQYSNPAFNALALVIEKVSNMKWQDFIKQKIFEPSGMTQSTITDGPHPTKDVAHAYVKSGSTYVESDYGEYPTFTAAGNGGVWCSINDLIKYEQAIVNHVFISSDHVAKSRSIYHPENWKDSNEPHLGLSWFISTITDVTNQNSIKQVSHTGSQGGFRSFYISIPEKDILYIGLFNRPVSNMNTMMRKAINLLNDRNWLD